MSDQEDPAPGGRERPPEHAPPGDGGGDDDDSMGPPKEPCECWCMHCKRTFMSDRMWFQRVVGDPQGFRGFWMCPTPNCGGAGFTFDIFPTDPDHPANDGWVSFEDDEDEDEDEDGEWDEEGEFSGEREGDEDAEADWDPNESKWKELDEALGDPDDDDIEGDEWKHGLAPGERPPPWAPTFSSDEARREWEAEQRSYDEPDRRPRELDWSDRPDRQPRRDDLTGDQHFREEDIPF